MDVITHDQLRNLIESGTPPCVSIFMATHTKSKELRQDPIELKNLIRSAEEQLIARKVDATQARQLLEPARALLDDPEFWPQNQNGLAIFIADGMFKVFRVPIEIEDVAIANDRFHVRPLLPLLSGKTFYVLAVSQKAARLLECTSLSCHEVPLPEDVATSMLEAIPPEDENQTRLERHGGGRSGPANSPGSFHGEDPDVQKSQREDMKFFFRQLDDGVRRAMKNPDATVVIAGADSITPFYRRATNLKNVHEEAIDGNPEHVPNDTLRVKAVALLEPVWHDELNRLQERFGTATGQSLASTELKDVLRAASAGRVDTLFVPRGVIKWGRHDVAANQVHVHDEPQQGDEDLIDRATVETLLTSGQIVVVAPEEVPGDREIAAIYRY
jgi:hypothetical protein